MGLEALEKGIGVIKVVLRGQNSPHKIGGGLHFLEIGSPPNKTWQEIVEKVHLLLGHFLNISLSAHPSFGVECSYLRVYSYAYMK